MGNSVHGLCFLLVKFLEWGVNLTEGLKVLLKDCTLLSLSTVDEHQVFDNIEVLALLHTLLEDDTALLLELVEVF